MTEPRWLTEDEQHVWQAYLALQRELQGAQERQLERDSGLSTADYTLLAPLSEAPDGLLRARELARMAGWERSRLSHQVSRMTKRGLVVREECPDDARGSMIRLTAAGREAIEAAAPEHVATVRRYFFDPLSAEETAQLGELFGRMLTKLARDR
ncbi:MarR family winged helix-turn-helix transcriptional regulator [Amycolatopsis sp. 195334CR]|uniref:MarR family winged helix-turn-helix transcriptional regulator n=1 Tax=Amycolatopsis sp. 195334CR TaxID=2814588 RepID=UPI001A8ED7B7|nr:MarR family transcriptional regulator [Amycolatopsis sp. 195334CR]MBN6041931.1 MarR family transcriptional regulator [Amycolatopsis sp. 195334CR]